MGQNISGQIYAYTSINEFVSGASTTYNIPIAIPDVVGGQLASINYTNGTGSLQLDTCYYPNPITLASTTQTIDLTSLTDPSGASINFARVREFIVWNATATASFDLNIYKGASNGWAFLPTTGIIYARYGAGYVRISDPYSTGGGNGHVTGGASKTITFDSGAHTVTFRVLILGTSVA